MKRKLYTKILRNFSEKHRVKFPAMTLRYSIEKVAYLDKASSEFFKQEASPCQKKVKHCCKKIRKGKKKKKKKA